MASSRRNRKRAALVGIAAGILALGATFGVVAAAVEHQAPPPVSEKVSAAYESGRALPKPTPKLVSLFIGDSYTAGSFNTVEWPDILAPERNWYYSNIAVGGSGYSNTAGNNFAAQLKKIEVTPDLIVVAGSRNDAYTPEKVEAAATDLYGQLKKLAPKARIIVIGPMWDNTAPVAGVKAADDAVRKAATNAGLTFIDALPENWLSDPALIQSDHVHPNDDGQKVLAQRIGQKLKDLGF